MHRHPIVIALLLAAATFAVSATVSWLRPPVPRVHDEFSYLLAGDTYAEGRATNPQHPMWRHFEVMHVIHDPTYASKYPPGQGIALAVGQVLGGSPIVGVWLTSVAAVVACYWMLLGFTPPKWAALGGACLAMHPGLLLTWGQGYWGGSLAFAGGALVLGAAARLIQPGRSLRTVDAAVMVAGALLLAITRPFEGFLLCLLVVVWMIVHWTRHGWPDLRRLGLRVLLPQVLLSMTGLWGLVEYNRAVTGDPLVMPYQVHEQTYGMCPLFLWGEPQPERDYRHDSIRKFHTEWSMDWFRDQQTWQGIAETKIKFLRWGVIVLLPFVLLVPALLLPWWRGTKYRWPMALLLTIWIATQVAVWNWPHYIAPVAPVVFLIAVTGLRNLRIASRQFSWNRAPVRALVAVQVLLCCSAIHTWVNDSDAGWHWYRNAMASHLEAQPGKHLVLVEYSPAHHPHEEWVWNRADIDSAKVVWAHSMSESENAELMGYFGDRQVWRVAADMPQPPLARYPKPTRQMAAVSVEGR